MTWLDRILAVPTVGFEFEPWVMTSSELAHTVRPMVAELVAADPSLTLSAPNLLGLIVDSSTGFNYQVLSNTITVQFTYRPQELNVPGALPQIEYKMSLRPYSDLLRECVSRMVTFCDHLMGHNARRMKRIGVVAGCSIPIGESPPGLVAFIDHLSQPWGGKPDRLSVSSITPRVGEGDGYFDRCHHGLEYNELERSGDVRLALDWQRVFVPPIDKKSHDIEKDLLPYISSALAYFERFGTGDLNYGVS